MRMMIFLKENTTIKCQESFLLKNHIMEEKLYHHRLKMLVSLLLVDRLHLSAMMVVDLSAVVVTGLLEVVVVVFQLEEVAIMNP
jgi:hypothetical protein